MALQMMDIYRKMCENQLPGETDEVMEDFQIVQINDFTQDSVRKEKVDLEECDLLAVMGLCPSRHGGLLDYPKIVTESSGLVAEKWEICLELVLRNREESGNVQIVANIVSKPAIVVNGDAKAKTKSPQASEEEINENNEDDFFASVSESASKLILHHAWMTETLVKSGDIEKLAAVAGGLALIRNRLWHYNEVIVTKQGTKQFQSLYRETCDLIEAICEQMTLYYSNNLTTVVLQDSESQNWDNPKPFHEGERLSYCIQMWWFSMETNRQYLWSSLPPNMSQNIFLAVLNDCLSILTHRYSGISPTGARLDQYRTDILAILLSVVELLPCIAQNLPMLSAPTKDHPKLLSIHAKCELLLSIMVMVTAPANSISNIIVDNPHSQTLPSIHKKKPSHLEPQKTWQELICPALYTKKYSLTTPATQLYLLSKLIADHPQPQWALMVQLCTSNNRAFSSTVFTQMGAYVPTHHKSGDRSQKCGLLSCSQSCLGAAGPNWPVLVAHGILLSLIHSNSESTTVVAHTLEPLLSKLSLASWECLHVSNIWSLRKPVWLASLVGVIEPFMAPAVHEVLVSVEEGRTWTLSHIDKAKGLLVESMLDMLDVLPLPIVGVLFYIKNIIPDSVKPLADSVVVQVLMATIYSSIFTLIPLLKQNRTQKEKVDFLLAFCESLCNEGGDVKLTVLEAALKLRMEMHESDNSFHMGPDNATSDMLQDKYEVAAYSILQDVNAKIPLMALHRFISYNADWIGWALGVDQTIPGETQKMKPWNNLPSPAPQPAQIMDRIGFNKFNSMMEHQLDWDSLSTHVLSSPTPALAKLLSLRPAYSVSEQPYIPPSEITIHKEIKEALEKKILSN
eukprot:TRINITY_DN28750_c0_g1_i1.p1 TRINITY_DN28750_c0_g1~~TRINITY_DN28750_c0_g1_i1.p1  ORF type:complete len:852 (+),score=156.49 TRINITY_DN28750_c0_g1_i1:642-3197(+)